MSDDETKTLEVSLNGGCHQCDGRVLTREVPADTTQEEAARMARVMFFEEYDYGFNSWDFEPAEESGDVNGGGG